MSYWYRVVGLLALWCGLWSPCQAQLFHKQDSMVEWHFAKQPLGEVLEEISQRHALNFSYANDHLPLQKRITFHSKGRPLKATLAALFDQNDILHAYIGAQVVLKPNAARIRKRAQRRQRKARREARERETLKRGRLFKRDWPGELMEPKNTEPEPRPVYPTTPVEPLVPTQVGRTAPLRFESVTDRPSDTTFKKVVRPRLAQVAFLPNVSTNPRHKKSIHIASLNLLWSQNGGVFGVEIGGLGNQLTRPMQGLQIGGAFNWGENDAYGLQIGGLINYNKGNFYGLQVAGFFSGNKDSHGCQLSAMGNLTQTLYGFQFGLLSNIATDVYGLQLGGLANFANGKLSGAQVAAGGNLTWGGKSAVQLAGVFNYSAKAQFQIAAGFNIAQTIDGAQFGAINATKEVNGIQAGAVNYTEQLNGVQIGLFNLASSAKGTMLGLINIVDSIKGVPLGLINIVKKNGYNRLEIATGDVLYCTVGAKMGVPRLYYSVQLGWQVNAESDYVWAIGAGIGTAVPLHARWDFHLEAITMHINEGVVWNPDLNLLHQIKPLLAYRLNERMSWFFGPTFNLLMSNAYHPGTGIHGSTLAPYTIIDATNRYGTNFKGWIGGTTGLRF